MITPARLPDPNSIPPRRRRLHARIEIGKEPVKVGGDPLDEIWWRGKQWAVTSYGIECLDGKYHFEAHRLAENPDYLWPVHMSRKGWVDIDDFTTAWMVGLLLHGEAAKVDPTAVRHMFGNLCPSLDEVIVRPADV